MEDEIFNIKKKLTLINEITYTKHAENNALPDRKLSKSDIEMHLKTLENLLSTERQENKYRLVFSKGKRDYLAITVRFIDERKLIVITAYPISARRLKRYLTWLQKSRR